MKQFSFVLNILLVAAVGVLYYLHFSSSKSPVAKSAGKPVSSQIKDSCANGHLVAFIEIDSVYDNVAHIKQEQKKLEADQEAAAKQYENSAMKFEKDKNDYIQKAQGMTPQQREQEEGKLMQAQQSIEANRQSQMQGLATKRSRTMEEIQSKLKQFLNEFNSDKRYAYIFATGAGLDYMMYKDSASNITADVIAGLNKSFEKKDK
ncbi:MAG TPA: OmpH family outer membrane protein [Ferruginibacter sp.]|nr:OmpH family outer membrane protein [Ferruginibacter sp.]